MNILDQILADKRDEIAEAICAKPLDAMRGEALDQPFPPGFRAALVSRPLGLIAEVKRRSPSVGLIRDPFDAAAIARAYEQGGAQALSVLMDQKYFGGGAEDFAAVRAAVKLPLLYKEFVVDAWQVWQARQLGASAVLLIVAGLEPAMLAHLLEVVNEAGLEALVEVHDEDEARSAVDAGAQIIGINNRNLKTFVTSLATTEQVMGSIPAGRLIVSESGIRDASDTQRLRGLGVGAVLVGEHLLKHSDLVAAVKNLMEP